MKYTSLHSFTQQKAQALLAFSITVFLLIIGYDAIASETLLSTIIKVVLLVTIFISALRAFFSSPHEVHHTNVITSHISPRKDSTVDIKDETHTETFDLDDTESIRDVLEELSIESNHLLKEERAVNEKSDSFETSLQDSKSDTAYDQLVADIASHENKERGAKQKEFFSHQNNNDSRQYLGVNIAKIVQLSEEHHGSLSLQHVSRLLESDVHEHRIVGVWVLVQKYKHATDEKRAIVDFYLNHRNRIDNWDMTDLAARNIIGAYVHEEQSSDVLAQLLDSESLWDKRSALMATHTAISEGDVSLALFVAEKVKDIQDELVQSAIGWVLKEIFKEDKERSVVFMREHFSSLSKQAIRIGTERMEKESRKAFLRGEFVESVTV